MTAVLSIKDHQIRCEGDWTQWTVHTLEESLTGLPSSCDQPIVVDGSSLSSLDTAGAVFLLHKLRLFIAAKSVIWKNFSAKHQALLQLLLTQNLEAYQPLSTPDTYVTSVGKHTCQVIGEFHQFLRYFGEMMVFIWHCFLRKSSVRWPMVASHIEMTGYKAVPIVALLSLLIGIVLAYQLGHALVNYGANIYVVDISGMAILREFGPLITAIILAGRTSSSYAAQLGSMILNEEVDAINTLGLSVSSLLVLPRIIALFISLPLLSVLADILGTLGSMLMSHAMLDIGYGDFIRRFGSVIELRMFLIGMVKTPFFAFIIGSIGCFHGLQVKGGTFSIGYRTTLSVVHAIFMIMVADAGFSVLFNLSSM